ncbi:helix-turn-helix domain-containing protein [Desulfoplanes formicivorans]|uniref:HTH cro/C1-type domain-containing protein n=1 Tax=Desulfoplanes formicivorans TaxID=1592317 RepID=A0A194AH71_9BACT|nr:helix-turn-helix domain-containing protein [Desulfoplanes formicivorans]GAU08109.1 hypothetical protein DPF_0812 [Desulfoplanes formicivorans]
MKERTSNKSSHLGSHLTQGTANQNSFAFRLRKARESIGITQKELAKKIGVVPNSVQNYEGGTFPKGDVVAKIAEALNVSTDWLLSGKEELAPYGTGGDSGAINNDTAPEHERVAKTLEDGQDFNTAEIISKTIEILESKTVFTTAIVSNIEAFHEAIQMKKELQKFKAEMQTETAKMFNDIRKEVAKLRQENQQLRDEIRRDRDQEVTEDTG